MTEPSPANRYPMIPWLVGWLICGGANHTKDFAWHMPIEAARADRDQIDIVSRLPEQVYEHGRTYSPNLPRFGEKEPYYRVGHKAAGAVLDGRRHEELPWATCA